MDLNTLIDELEKTRGWLGGGNPEVTANGFPIVLAKTFNGSAWLELDNSKCEETDQEVEDRIGMATSDAENLKYRAERDVENLIETARDALKEALDKLNDL